MELNNNHWQHVRGSALIISMKAISLAFDVSSTKIPRLPRFDEYAGYALCPGNLRALLSLLPLINIPLFAANIVLGPFVTFSSYKSSQRDNRLSLKLIMQILLNSLLSIAFIVTSSCFLNYFISDHLLYIVTYRDALIFRCSHYFISFMSSATILVSGIDTRITSDVFGYQVTRPFDIELPRSLIPVVISWNIPIHMWVKTCKFGLRFIEMSRDETNALFADLFHNLKQFGKFNAILLTYLISSSLHGLNFQLAAVLLSIGIFTYVEYSFRNVLAEILDACVAANKCDLDSDGSCSSKGHKNTSTLHWVKMINFGFGVFTVVLLAYLGVLLELDTLLDHGKGFSWERNLKKWIDLKFFGHVIVLIWYVVYLILKN